MRVIMTGGGTGGHVNPAIAIADEIMRRWPQSEICFVGTERGIEHKLVPAAGYPIRYITVQGIRRKLTLENIKTLRLALKAKRDSKKILKEWKPDVVIGTGGYICWPVLKAAHAMKIPTFLHEANAVPGVAVKMLQKECTKLFVNFEETVKELKYPEKAMRVGNPMKGGFRTVDKQSARKKLGMEGYRYVILSCGGSMGAERINREVVELMDHWGKRHPEVLIVHSSGAIDHADTVADFKKRGLDRFKNLKLFEYIYDMPNYMAAADLVISRAGSLTLSELALMRKSCILIPSPNVTNNHQYKNAKVLENAGGAILFEEKELFSETLIDTVDRLIFSEEERRSMAEKIAKFAVMDSEKQICREIGRILETKKQ